MVFLFYIGHTKPEVIILINLKDSNYFNSLNKMVQESIMQSGKDFETESELIMFVSNIDPSGGTGAPVNNDGSNSH